MKKFTPIYSDNSDKSSLKHPNEYQEFISWYALPASLRFPKTQKLLAKHFGIHEDTLSDWKKKEGFWNEVKNQRTILGREKTSEVIASLYKKILLTGDAGRVKLWLQIFEGFQEKTEKEDFTAIMRQRIDEDRLKYGA